MIKYYVKNLITHEESELVDTQTQAEQIYRKWQEKTLLLLIEMKKI